VVRVLWPLPSPLPPELEVTGERHHHLVRVLRAKVGDVVELFDGRGTRCEATVAALGPKSARLTLGEASKAPPARRITVAQALPKGDKLELVLQKCTELGAHAFIPLLSAHVVARPPKEKADARRARWQKIVEEAARQCGRADVPVVHPLVELKALPGALPQATGLWVLDEAEQTRTLSQAFAAAAPSQDLALVVGPEGGLARDEVASLVAAGATPVTLGVQVLRTETAALAALAVLLHLQGRLG
jgi:16S rRNA (uracil1498-N3)-methyltransferase